MSKVDVMDVRTSRRVVEAKSISAVRRKEFSKGRKARARIS